MDTIAQLKVKYERLRPLLNERQRRLWAATEALALGRGGITWAAEATGLSRMTVRAGLREVHQQERQPDQVLALDLQEHGQAGGGSAGAGAPGQRPQSRPAVARLGLPVAGAAEEARGEATP